MIELRLNYDLFMIKNIWDNPAYFGGDQEWYRTRLQRLAGCGATTGSSIFMYEKRKRGAEVYTKKEFLSLMNEMWECITPGNRGVDSVDMFAAGFEKFLKGKSIPHEGRRALEVPQNKHKRPSKAVAFAFLKEALENDTPVAFLNLGCGMERRLDSWHWVTITGLKFLANLDMLHVEIADEGMKKTIDLGLWLETTDLGGGFVYYKNLQF
ncbi:MAG: hypothetical protein IIY69_07745 [Clostridia bacterium]|nr:hypothetical protein [Clostridia bacterium]